MPNDMFCQKCSKLYTHDEETGQLRCPSCKEFRVIEQHAEEPVRYPEQGRSAEVEQLQGTSASGGSTPPLCAPSGGVSDVGK